MLNREQLQSFSEHGFLLINGFFKPDRDFGDVIAAYDRILDDNGAPASYLPVSPERIARRVATLYRESGNLFAQNFDISLPARPKIPKDTPICLDPSIFKLLTHPDLLDVVESLIGGEIALNPVCHVRIKPPQVVLDHNTGRNELARNLNQNNRTGLMSQTPWHQDNAVFTEEIDDVDVLTVWFPITPAPIEKGCLQVIPGSHKGGIRPHCPGSTTDLSIPDQLITEEPQPLPMEPGDLLILHRKTCHASLPNLSGSARFSFDLRFQPIGTPNGRSVLPSFPIRSRNAPDSMISDPHQWSETWRATRTALAATEDMAPMNRWSADSPLCA